MTSALITAAAAVGLLIIIIVAIILFRMLSDNFGQSTYVYSRSYRRKKRSQPLIFLIGILAGLTIGAIVAYFIILKPGQSQPPIEPIETTSAEVQVTAAPQVTPTPLPTSTPPLQLTDGPIIGEVTTNTESYPDGKIPRYEKLELTFQLQTVAQNLQFPYDPAPPPGLEPGLGVSVDAQFSPDNWQTVFIQPAFYYQDFESETKRGGPWLYPTANFSWKVRFTPNQPGDWQFKLVAQDASGKSESDTFTFTVTPSEHKGFIKVSQNDPRYFEYEDGSYFPALGYNFELPASEETFQTMADNGLQLIRTWLPSQFSIFGSAWSPWQPFGAAPQSPEPNRRWPGQPARSFCGCPKMRPNTETVFSGIWSPAPSGAGSRRGYPSNLKPPTKSE